jgi:hypothetical protein
MPFCREILVHSARADMLDDQDLLTVKAISKYNISKNEKSSNLKRFRILNSASVSQS